jgi:hypothetical protein
MDVDKYKEKSKDAIKHRSSYTIYIYVEYKQELLYT